MPIDALQALRERQQEEIDELDRKRRAAITARLAAQAERRKLLKRPPSPGTVARQKQAAEEQRRRLATREALVAPDKLRSSKLHDVADGHNDSIRSVSLVCVETECDADHSSIAEHGRFDNPRSRPGTGSYRPHTRSASRPSTRHSMRRNFSKQHYMVTGGRDCLAILWTKPTDSIVSQNNWLRRRHFAHADWVEHVSLSFDAQIMCSAVYQARSMLVWNASTGHQIACLGVDSGGGDDCHSQPITSIVFGPAPPREVEVQRLHVGSRPPTASSSRSAIESTNRPGTSTTARTAGTAATATTTRTDFSNASWDEETSQNGEPDEPEDAGPDYIVATTSTDCTCKLWTLSGGGGGNSLLHTLHHATSVLCCTFAPPAPTALGDTVEVLATGCITGEVYLWNWKSATRLRILRDGHRYNAAVSGLCFSPDNTLLASSSHVEGSLCVWDVFPFTTSQELHDQAANQSAGDDDDEESPARAEELEQFGDRFRSPYLEMIRSWQVQEEPAAAPHPLQPTESEVVDAHTGQTCSENEQQRAASTSDAETAPPAEAVQLPRSKEAGKWPLLHRFHCQQDYTSNPFFVCNPLWAGDELLNPLPDRQFEYRWMVGCAVGGAQSESNTGYVTIYRLKSGTVSYSFRARTSIVRGIVAYDHMIDSKQRPKLPAGLAPISRPGTSRTRPSTRASTSKRSVRTAATAPPFDNEHLATLLIYSDEASSIDDGELVPAQNLVSVLFSSQQLLLRASPQYDNRFARASQDEFSLERSDVATQLLQQRHQHRDGRTRHSASTTESVLESHSENPIA